LNGVSVLQNMIYSRTATLMALSPPASPNDNPEPGEAQLDSLEERWRPSNWPTLPHPPVCWYTFKVARIERSPESIGGGSVRTKCIASDRNPWRIRQVSLVIDQLECLIQRPTRRKKLLPTTRQARVQAPTYACGSTWLRSLGRESLYSRHPARQRAVGVEFVFSGVRRGGYIARSTRRKSSVRTF
jgi:hypothetical protein